MKKVGAVILAVIMAFTLFIASGCFLFDITPRHKHDFGDSYFMLVKCSVDGCNVYGRAPSENTFKDDFKYDFNAVKKSQIQTDYNELCDILSEQQQSYAQMENAFNVFEEDMKYIVYQYQVATVFYSAYCEKENDKYDKAYDEINEFYNNMFANYYKLFRLIYESIYKDEFYKDMSQDEINQQLILSDTHGGGADNQNAADKLADEYNSLLDNTTDTSDRSALYAKYKQYVNANNIIAKQYGYDDYLDYAYANVYMRDYTPDDATEMRQYVKTYIAPVLLDVYKMYSNMEGFDGGLLSYFKQMDDIDYYRGFAADSLFSFDNSSSSRVKSVTDLIGGYFKYLTSDSVGKKEINFYKHAEELFKNGNYYTGTEDSAYHYYITSKDKAVLYFGDVEDEDGYYNYSTAFTFTHEFGHYYNSIYNGGIELSRDHDETQSQGNEMLFLAWLNENKPAIITKGHDILQCEQLLNILLTIVQASIVDEFEQAVYTDSYGSGEFANGISSSRYDALYKQIQDSYGVGISDLLGRDYWTYVVVDSSAYYISYAMSALPSLEIYVKAQTDGLNAARDSFFKLYTFSDNEGYEDMAYQQVLAYAGLDHPFDVALYTKINNYFKSYSV